MNTLYAIGEEYSGRYSPQKYIDAQCLCGKHVTSLTHK